ATVVANDTAGGLLLLSLASGHPALGRVGRLVLTNCESYDQFPPDKLRKATQRRRLPACPAGTAKATTSSRRTSSGRRRRCVAHCPGSPGLWSDCSSGCSSGRRPSGAGAFPPSPRADWTTSARNRSTARPRE